MVKKILPFLCGLAPLCAFGDAPVDINVGASEYQNIDSGNYINAGAVNVYNLMVVDESEPQTMNGNLFVLNTAGNPFAITSTNGIAITNNVGIDAGRGLQLGGNSGTPVDIEIGGSISASGTFVATNVDTFESRAISSETTLTVNANSISTGMINSSDGDTTLSATGALDIGGIMASATGGSPSPTTKISGATIDTGNVQNLSGTMTFTTPGDFTGTGNVENSGTALTISGAGSTKSGDIEIAGILKNDSDDGLLTIKANSLNVLGGGDANPSFVNSGNVIFDIAGMTSFGHGINLSNMASGDELNITTGQLVLNANDATNNIIANKAANITITVNNGTLNAGSISNGVSNGTSNDTAVMSLTGVNVAANSVQNYGNHLTIGTVNADSGNITISGGVIGAAETWTEIAAGGNLVIEDEVSNFGDMDLYGSDINIVSITNSGDDAVLNISAPTDDGVLYVGGSITNSGGQTTITSRQMTLANAVKNNSGTLSVVGSDAAGVAVSVGSVIVNGGEFDFNAWAGGVSAGSLAVSDGVLKLGNSVHNFTATDSIGINGNVNLASAGTVTDGDGDVYLTSTTGSVDMKSINGQITIGGNIVATADDGNAHVASFDASKISVVDVTVQNDGNSVAFGSSTSNSSLDVSGAISATDGGTVKVYSANSKAGSLTESDNGQFIMYGDSFTVKNGAIDIADGVWFGVASTSGGMIIQDTSAFELINSTTNNDIVIHNGIGVGDEKTLTLQSGRDVNVYDDVSIDGTLNLIAARKALFNDSITTGGDATQTLTVSAQSIELNGIENNSHASFSATNGKIVSDDDITNTGVLVVDATDSVELNDIDSSTNSADMTIISRGSGVALGDLSVSGGVASISGSSITVDSLNLDGGTTTMTSQTIGVDGDVAVTGNVVQGPNSSYTSSATDALKLVNTSSFDANSLTITDGVLIAHSGNTEYTITGVADFGDGMTIANNATVNVEASSIKSGDVTNGGVLVLNGASGVTFGNIQNNSELTINTNALLTGTSFVNGTGTAVITSDNMLLSSATGDASEFNIGGVLYQKYTGALSSGDVNITSNNYTITAPSVTTGGIAQADSTSMVINTSDLTVNGNINANNLQIAAYPSTDWASIAVNGNVSGGVEITGLKYMTISGDYIYDNDSMLHAAILQYPANDYWADVSLVDDSTFGQITNHSDDPTNALIYVGGEFNSNVSNFGNTLAGSELVSPQIGINLYSVVDSGSAIWLLYAEEGVVESDIQNRLRNLKVNFCNADGSKCFNYFDSIIDTENLNIEDELPIYLSVRDYNNDGTNDSLYIVFDPRFGGPVTVFPIEPIVAHADNASDNASDAANALDKMIADALTNNGFDSNSPIEAIPVVFEGTNLSELATEVYNRMEQYTTNYDGTALANISRLIQPRELEQVVGSIALNEHASFRDFEDHMFDEFIWNRNRNLSKVWFDADFGMIRQHGSDNKRLNGNRFNITAGYDWQNDKTTILGLMAHVSHMSSKNSDSIDLGYIPGNSIEGHNRMRVSDTNIGIGAYMLKTLGFKTRLYGNGFIDAHVLDVSREQNYVDDITGSGTAFSLISEWGLLHDWLNQYIVGNLYARLGYNFGFSINEDAGGDEYMRMRSDGYFIFTPGYSLTAQKRIYPSAWFQIRPYASIGIEYDVLGMPDAVQFKFDAAKSYSDYDIEFNPLWANIGGGVELLSVVGAQVGLDYRYQYNSNIQMHNIRLSGSLRF